VIICIAANPSVDRTLAVDRLVMGRIHRPHEVAVVAGGKGLNAARAAKVLGAQVRAVALVGGHAGRWIVEQCEQEGLELATAWAAGETRSSHSVAAPGQEMTEFYEPGAAVTGEEWAAFAELAARHAAGATWTTVSGSLPAGAPGDGYVPLVGLSRTAFDSREQGLAARPAVVKVNAAEAAELTGRPAASRSDALSAARTLHEASGGAAIVTRGAEGAVMVTPDGRGLSAGLTAEGRFPVGSGDAFLAGLVVALDAGAEWGDALAAAAGAGAANAEQPGPGRLDPDRARMLADAAVVTTVE
jgi:1-phosphofructokinase